jgi:catechol 2,3-dioxygenase-like lactoylglutathione lyase family enzyme
VLARSRVTAFVATTDAGQAGEFYEKTLGLRLIEDAPFALVFDANGAELRVQKVRQFTPQPFTVFGWNVDDIEAAVDALTARGVVFQRYEGMPQDARGIWESGAARVAWFRDPDGNTLSLAQ